MAMAIVNFWIQQNAGRQQNVSSKHKQNASTARKDGGDAEYNNAHRIPDSGVWGVVLRVRHVNRCTGSPTYDAVPSVENTVPNTDSANVLVYNIWPYTNYYTQATDLLVFGGITVCAVLRLYTVFDILPNCLVFRVISYFNDHVYADYVHYVKIIRLTLTNLYNYFIF